MGFFNAASAIGVAVSPPILAVMMLVMGWRGMSTTIGVLGIFLAVSWCMLYCSRECVELIVVEQAHLNTGSVNARRDSFSFAEWRSLLRNRTMWGMTLGSSGINYTVWPYPAWPPGYLQTAYNLDSKSIGLMVTIPFLFGAAGMLVNGHVTSWLVKGGMAPIKSRKICIVIGMFYSTAFTLVVPQVTTSMTAVLLIGTTLFCIHFAGTSCWGLIHVAVASRMTTSVGSIQNFASFVCVSSTPIITGFIIDTTYSLRLALIICGCVTAAGALIYIFLVCQPINDPRKD